MVLPDSSGIPRAPPYSGVYPKLSHDFNYEALTLFGWPSHAIRLSLNFRLGCYAEQPGRSYNPKYTTPACYHVYLVWALPPSLAATKGIEFSFSS